MKLHRWRGRLCLICLGLFCLFGLGLSLEGCGCASDKDCQGSLRCGPGGACLSRCFPGETSACLDGYVCNSEGNACVQGTTTTPDAGSGD
ncbi:MAG: hypothetical protein H6728_13660 [Myxococcales bacterium]|nr:hypothetical protein [Myxococcales bacterium]MCB9644117.1 hypothetical protein [Myxococcales bacterium]